MERGGSSKRDPKRVPNSGTNIQKTNAPMDIPNIGNNELNPEENLRRNLNQYLPMASVTRIMRNILPSHVRITDDTKETVQECVSEFISFITTEANDKCHGECRKTISAEDIISAMETLGFDNYVEPLTIYLNKYRAQDPENNVHHMPSSEHNSEHV